MTEKTTIDDLRQKPHWSYSALNCYLQCPLRYYYRYVANAPVERTGVCIPFGKAFHSTLSARAVHGMNFSLEEGRESFAECFRLETEAAQELRYKEGETFDTCLAKGFDMLKAAWDSWQDEFAVKGVAVPFSVTVPGLKRPLVGEFDLVVDDGGADTIVDWKTSASKWGMDRVERDMQPSAYCYAYKQEHGISPVFRFDIYTKAKTPTVTSLYTVRKEDALARFAFTVAGIEKGVEQECFYPNVCCMNCAECPYRNRCEKEGR